MRIALLLRTTLALVLFSPWVSQAEDIQRAQVTVLATTDLHGRIRPLDYFTQKPSNVGLAKLSTLVKSLRKTHPDLLLVDCGDTIQGTPLVYYHNRRNNGPVDPMMLVMNSLEYTSMTLGNHEYNFGLGVLEKARAEARFPWISANTYRKGTDDLVFPPYVIKEVQGVRVGILGLTTPGIPHWENPENFAGLEFRETVSEARKWMRVLREQERVDVVVGTFHMGLDYPLADGKPEAGDMQDENACLAIATQIPGFDVIFMGHTHRKEAALTVNGVLLAQAGRWGDHLARADVYLTRKKQGAWAVLAKTSEALPVTDAIAPDESVMKLSEPYHVETEAWLGREIGSSAQELTAGDASMADNAILDLIHRVQLDAGRADVSVVANLNASARIPKGRVTVRDIASLYIYENTLYVVEVSGAQFRAALEHSARFFLPFETGKKATDLINPAIPRYNFDVAEGVSYEIALREPVGRRIKNLTFRGEALRDDQRLRVAMSNYRYNGGGGFTMYKDAPVVSRSKEEIRDLIIAWVEAHRDVPAAPSGNWRILE